MRIAAPLSIEIHGCDFCGSQSPAVPQVESLVRILPQICANCIRVAQEMLDDRCRQMVEAAVEGVDSSGITAKVTK